MKIGRLASLLAVLVVTGAVGCKSPSALPEGATLGAQGGDAPPPPGQAAPAPNPDPWPRTIQTGTATLLVYSPQVESWQGNVLGFRCAVGAKSDLTNQEVYGVVWGTAQTQVDRERRLVSLENLKLTRSSFPTLPDNGAAYLASLNQNLPAAGKMIPLARIEASLAASAAAKPSGLPVQNPVPKILVSYAPAILVPIDGAPVLRKVPDRRFERVINTRALILREPGGSTFYLHVYDGWLAAQAVSGPWGLAATLPLAIDGVVFDR